MHGWRLGAMHGDDLATWAPAQPLWLGGGRQPAGECPNSAGEFETLTTELERAIAPAKVVSQRNHSPAAEAWAAALRDPAKKF